MTISKNALPVVQFTNNKLTTTSRNIAAVFGKPHSDVLKAIRALDVPEEFNRGNFPPVEYHDAKGEKRLMHNLTRDGFTILVMGFTGPKAMKFKLAYIEAFNKMEAELRRGDVPAVQGNTEIRELCNHLKEQFETIACTARSMDVAVQQLSSLAPSELLIRDEFGRFAAKFNDFSNRQWQRDSNHTLDFATLRNEVRMLKNKLDDTLTPRPEENEAKKAAQAGAQEAKPETARNTITEADFNDFFRYLKGLDFLRPVEVKRMEGTR